jgi:hypothetical protein
MIDTPMPVTGFSMDVSMSEDGQTLVALLTLETGELAFEFAINENGGQAVDADQAKAASLPGSGRDQG